MPPPQVDAYGLGFRVPMIVVSPYARRGFVDHIVMDHASIVRFIEANWNLTALNARVASANDLFGAFSLPPMNASLAFPLALQEPVRGTAPLEIPIVATVWESERSISHVQG